MTDRNGSGLIGHPTWLAQRESHAATDATSDQMRPGQRGCGGVRRHRDDRRLGYRDGGGSSVARRAPGCCPSGARRPSIREASLARLYGSSMTLRASPFLHAALRAIRASISARSSFRETRPLMRGGGLSGFERSRAVLFSASIRATAASRFRSVDRIRSPSRPTSAQHASSGMAPMSSSVIHSPSCCATSLPRLRPSVSSNACCTIASASMDSGERGGPAVAMYRAVCRRGASSPSAPSHWYSPCSTRARFGFFIAVTRLRRRGTSSARVLPASARSAS